MTLKQNLRVQDRVDRLTGQRLWSALGIYVEHAAAIHEALPVRHETVRIVGTRLQEMCTRNLRPTAQQVGRRPEQSLGKGPKAFLLPTHTGAQFKSLGKILLSERGLARTTIPIRLCCFPSWAVAEAKGQANSQQRQKPYKKVPCGSPGPRERIEPGFYSDQ